MIPIKRGRTDSTMAKRKKNDKHDLQNPTEN